MTEPKINNFYLVQNRIPAKLINKKGNKFKFKNLYNEETFETDISQFREIELKQSHFDEIGFTNDNLNDLYVKPLYVVLGEELLRLKIEYYGYLIFDKEDIVETQKKYNTVINEIHEKDKADHQNISKLNKSFQKEFGSILYLNQLFELLEKKEIKIENKERIAVL